MLEMKSAMAGRDGGGLAAAAAAPRGRPARKKSPPTPRAGRGGQGRADGRRGPAGPPRGAGEAPAAILAFRARLDAILRARGLSRRGLRLLLDATTRDHFPDAVGLRGSSRSAIGRWFESQGGPPLIHLLILARCLGTTVDAILDPAVPPGKLPPSGELPPPGHARAAAGLSDDEAALIEVLRRSRLDVDEAFHRLYNPQSQAPTADQIRRIVEDVLRARPKQP